MLIASGVSLVIILLEVKHLSKKMGNFTVKMITTLNLILGVDIAMKLLKGNTFLLWDNHGIQITLFVQNADNPLKGINFTNTMINPTVKGILMNFLPRFVQIVARTLKAKYSKLLIKNFT